MSTLNDDWKGYRDAVYPTGMPARQNLECHQAFMAGALCYSQQIDAIAALPEKEAMIALSKLKNEVWEINAARMHTLKARNARFRDTPIPPGASEAPKP